MAKKSSETYVCNSCGESFSKWAGKCLACGQWNTIVAFREAKGGVKTDGRKLEPRSLKDIDTEEHGGRLSTDMSATDHVLGGGIVPGSLVLIAGEPGVGKSTLILQIVDTIAKSKKVLYVSGEESVNQIKSRADRLKVNSDFDLSSSNSADDVAKTISSGEYDLMVVDSIQTMICEGVQTGGGSISQITNSTQLIMRATKNSKTAVVIVGHVTKGGNIAGPKLLEHMVDVVLALEGEKYGGMKLLRSAKNRFGSTNEVAIYDMTDKGLVEVDNPSAMLLNERRVQDGSVVYAAVEGSRSVLVEVQALVNRTNFGYPKRTASGIDLNRLNLLIAVLNQRTKLDLADSDVYVNVVGGLKIQETAIDLAVCMAIASAAKGMVLKEDAVAFGEVGLSGEIRNVPFSARRIEEAKKMKFKRAIGPEQSDVSGEFLYKARTLKDTLNEFLKDK